MDNIDDTFSLNNASDGWGLIFLVGFMGCGKTTLGRKLASRLGLPFFDLDHILEAQAGMSIAEYFSVFGESAFRQLEAEVLKQTAYPKHAVVSTGGGLPCFFDNMDWMNAHGKTIYIKLPPKTLASRLEQEKHKRPVLNGRNENELITFIEEKLTERDIFYTQASIIANGLDLTADGLEQLLKR